MFENKSGRQTSEKRGKSLESKSSQDKSVERNNSYKRKLYEMPVSAAAPPIN